jgi:hypothetical protein
MRNLLLIPLLALMAGCVTYYYPAAESPVAVRYASEDAVYDDYGLTVDSHDYVSARYYPWWSMDYFYLGSGYYDSGISIGFGTGYRPWYRHYGYVHDPFWYPSWYYDPWYYSFWHAPVHFQYSYYDYAHHNPYWHTRYRAYNRRHDRGHDYYYDDEHRYVRRHRRADPHPGSSDTLIPPNDRGARQDMRREGPARPGPASRRVTVAPGGASSERGMVVRSRDDAKRTRSRIEPVKSRALTADPDGGAATSSPTVTRRDSGVSVARRSAGDTRYRAGSKPVQSRTGPAPVQKRVTVQPDDRAAASQRAGQSPPATARVSRGSMTVRAPTQAKVGKSRTQPVTGAPIQVPRAVRVTPSTRAVRPARPAPAASGAPQPRAMTMPRAAPNRASPRAAAAPRPAAPKQARNTPPAKRRAADRDKD